MSLRPGTVNIIKILSKNQTTSTKHMDRTCNINDHTNSQRIRHLINWISFRATSLPSICRLFLYRNARLVSPSLDYWGEIAVRDARYFCIGNLAARLILLVSHWSHFSQYQKKWRTRIIAKRKWSTGVWSTLQKKKTQSDPPCEFSLKSFHFLLDLENVSTPAAVQWASISPTSDIGAKQSSPDTWQQ